MTVGVPDQTTPYRDSLAAAHARIQSLERELYESRGEVARLSADQERSGDAEVAPPRRPKPASPEAAESTISNALTVVPAHFERELDGELSKGAFAWIAKHAAKHYGSGRVTLSPGAMTWKARDRRLTLEVTIGDGKTQLRLIPGEGHFQALNAVGSLIGGLTLAVYFGYLVGPVVGCIGTIPLILGWYAANYRRAATADVEKRRAALGFLVELTELVEDQLKLAE